MNFLLILVGIFVIIAGVYVWRLAQETPEDEWVPWDWGAKRSHELAYLQAAAAWLLGGFLILMGIIL